MTRQAIVMTQDGGLASAEIAKAGGVSVSKGQRLRATAPLDFGPYGVVPSGSTGRVTYVNGETGETQVTLDRREPLMDGWHNTFSLMPYETDDILSGLCAGSNNRPCWRTAAAAFAVLLVLWAGPDAAHALGDALSWLADGITAP